MSASTPLSGEQFFLRFGNYEATIATVGGTLRSLTYAGRDLVQSFCADSVRPAFRGAVLAPWPNRIVDGHYYFGGQSHALSLTEPERGHALHGLVAWAHWLPISAGADFVSLRHTIAAQSGYPFQIQLTVTYTLSAEGLTWRVVAVNSGSSVAPYGVAPHPYLVAGEGLIDDWTLTVPAEKVLEVSPKRLIPTGLSHVADYDAGSLDFRGGRQVGGTFIDHSFTGIDWSADGIAQVDVVAPSGTGVQMQWDRRSPWVQVYTPQAPGPDAWRSSLAVEPMTCPPDAFNSCTDLVVLKPGAEHAARWRISAL